MEIEGSPLLMPMSPVPAFVPVALVSLPAMVASPGEWGNAVWAASRSAALPSELMRLRTVDLRHTKSSRATQGRAMQGRGCGQFKICR